MTRSLSSHFDQPSTIAAMVSQPGTGERKDEALVLNAQSSQERPENPDDPKINADKAKEAALSQHGQDDD